MGELKLRNMFSSLVKYLHKLLSLVAIKREGGVQEHVQSTVNKDAYSVTYT